MGRPRITFVQKDPFPNFGILSIAGYLKLHGIDSDVIVTELEKDIFEVLKNNKPDIIGITCMSTEYLWAIDIINALDFNFPNIPLIIGGVHPTVYADQISPELPLDFICIGEGEEVLVELFKVKDSEPDAYSNINGLMYKRNDEWVKTSMCQRLSALNWQEEREIYYRRYPTMAGDDSKQFLSGRGCYYTCHFCFNTQINSLYENNGLIVRRKKPDLFIREIKEVVSRYGARSLYFADDIFASDINWLREFAQKYRTQISLPFMCTARANMITDEIARLLREAGCYTVSIGVESGDEEIRRNILGKRISDDVFIRMSQILHDNKILLQTSNMFVLPGETVEKALKTIELNIRMKTKFAFCSFLMPFPGSEMAKIAQDMGVLKRDYTFKDMPNSFFTKSVLSIPDRYYIENIHNISYWCIRYPWLYPFLKRFVRVRLPFLFKIISLGGLFFRYKGERRLGFFNAVRLFWRFRKSA